MRGQRTIAAFGAALALAAGCAPAARRSAAPAPAVPASAAASNGVGDRAALAAVVRRSLRRELIDAWYPRAVDRARGGYFSDFDAAFALAGPQDKMVVTQARHVWTASRAAQFFPGDTVLLPVARHGVAFLRDVLWDREAGGFFWLVARDGTPKPGADGRLVKQAYGNAFAIYGLAAYADAARDTAALRLAADAFRWLDAHAHDPAHGGYYNYLARDGTPLRAGYAGDPPKDQNSSIHLLEAFTELYRVWPDPVLRARLAEMLALVRDTIRVAPGTLTLFSTADWRPVSWRDSSEAARRADRYYHDHVSFGHDVETAYLLLEAAEALGGAAHGGRADARTEAAAKQMVDHALRTGWDAAAGGFWDGAYYYPGQATPTIVLPTKAWWAQAEGLNTLLLMADRYPGDPLGYGTRFRAQWAYVDRYLIDHARGGWYEGGLDREPGRAAAPKGHIWKAAYHDGRALMNVARRLEAPAR